MGPKDLKAIVANSAITSARHPRVKTSCLDFDTASVFNVSQISMEIARDTAIGKGFYVGHPYNIMISPRAVLGENINIHKGVTIGQENRGARKGTPTIGNRVWIGINATIVGNITIGEDVLIAPQFLCQLRCTGP